MVRATLYPGADTKARWKGNGNATLSTIDKILLHTTESSGLPAFSGNHPNIVYVPATRKWYHCTPINGSATALSNDGSHMTNRANVVQIEIVGFAKDSAKLPQTAIDDLGAFVAWMFKEWGVPVVAAPKWTGSNTTARMSWCQFVAFKGLLGHQHAPGNNHWDPGLINAPAIIAAAQKLLKPTPVPPTPVVPVRSLLSINAQWPGFASTHALPWSQRLPMLVDAVKRSKAPIVVFQELGKTEAAEMADKLPGWGYQRAQGGGKGLNCVFWHKSQLTYGKTHDWNIESFGQMQRTLIAVKLQYKDGAYVWAGSTHLAAGASDLSDAAAIKARTAQANQIGDLLDGYRQILVGADWNSPYAETSPTSVRGILHSRGFTFRPPIKDSKHNGIDGVGAKQRVKLLSEIVVPLGKASDHEGRLVTFTVPAGAKT